MTPNPQSIKQYAQVNTAARVEDASPHMLIQMLINGALEKMAAAKGFIEHGDIEKKGQYIFWAISIINGLRSSLNIEKGGDIAVNLDRLYDYMERRLVEANKELSIDKIDEVMHLMREIKEGWDGIPSEYRDGVPS